tara:strand:+ start:290 stop:520 length:231 start_codon:yes stop_codon:yes gene_type:complete
MTQRDDGHDYRDSKNKAQAYERKKKEKELSAFKDGVADALLEGYASDWHENLYYYKQGYDFGLKMYDELKKINEVV